MKRFLKRMRKLIEDILYNRRKDAVTLPLRFFMRLLASVYGTVVFWRNFLYDRRLLKVLDVPCRVISIGNIIIGGTGKTPVTIMTANLIKENGLAVAVVSHGYKRRDKSPRVVSDGTSVLMSARDAGDEPHITASSLTSIPVVVGKDRYKAAKLAYERFRPDVIVLDDAMQHRRLYRNVDIVTMEADNPIGSEYLLPRGLLRESPYYLKRAKAVVITRCYEDHSHERIERMIRYYDRKVQIFWSRYVVTGLREPWCSDKIELETIRGKKVAALSNIVNPDSFYRILESHGSDIVCKHAMPDHHCYNAEELEIIEKNSLDAGAEILIMTAKDERNLPEGYDVKVIKKLVLDIKAELIENVEDYLKIISPVWKQ